MKKGFIIIAIVLLITLYIANKINTAKQLEFSVGIPKNVSLQTGALTFILPLKVQNVLATSLRVKALDFDILSAGKSLGKALLTTPVTIAGNGFTIINVNVSIGALDLLQAASSIVNLFKSGKVNLTLDGLVYAEGFQVPINQSFELDYKNVL